MEWALFGIFELLSFQRSARVIDLIPDYTRQTSSSTTRTHSWLAKTNKPEYQSYPCRTLVASILAPLIYPLCVPTAGCLYNLNLLFASQPHWLRLVWPEPNIKSNISLWFSTRLHFVTHSRGIFLKYYYLSLSFEGANFRSSHFSIN